MNEYLIIIPAFNEEANIGKVLQGIYARKLPVDVLIIDDGSLDKTAAIARSQSAIVVSHPCNLGYGAALQTGYQYAFAKGYRYLIQFDADDQHDPASLPSMIDELKKGESDILIGSRYLVDSGFAAGFMKKLATVFFRWLIARLTGVKVSDPTSGLRGIASKVFGYYSVRDRFPADFPDADILIQMILQGYRVKEIPVQMRQRLAGVSMHAGLKPFFYMLKIMLSIGIVILRHQLTKKVPDHE
ncbi:glycosyltransferase family 2 protein [Paenibacillus alginolyticus]|uniref:glycosyltransferase family 2 protein n=1 Tax=Paenibacillus alginolyticus TaxID=59839 RepID=UPI0004159130|nr:glycosyltransferase family 2 protein [Paenibacillus alginolyticus]MCY9664237.1 glycosyltransferase family 2 protein [Paenibacillus alginolyticus]